MFTARITGVIPKGMPLPAAPVETKQFTSLVEAKQWLLGEALYNLPTPVEKVEVFSANGQSEWREWHWSHDALKSKNELWWDAKEPDRKEIEKAKAERRQKISAGEIPDSDLSLKEQFDKANPPWRGPFFAWIPTKTVDAGVVWMTEYWERSFIGLRYKNKGWFLDRE